jgi:hypothetical protein
MRIPINNEEKAFKYASHGIISNGGYLNGNNNKGEFGFPRHKIEGYYRFFKGYAEITFTRIPWYAKNTAERQIQEYLKGA